MRSCSVIAPPGRPAPRARLGRSGQAGLVVREVEEPRQPLPHRRRRAGASRLSGVEQVGVVGDLLPRGSSAPGPAPRRPGRACEGPWPASEPPRPRWSRCVSVTSAFEVVGRPPRTASATAGHHLVELGRGSRSGWRSRRSGRPCRSNPEAGGRGGGLGQARQSSLSRTKSAQTGSRSRIADFSGGRGPAASGVVGLEVEGGAVPVGRVEPVEGLQDRRLAGLVLADEDREVGLDGDRLRVDEVAKELDRDAGQQHGLCLRFICRSSSESEQLRR